MLHNKLVCPVIFRRRLPCTEKFPPQVTSIAKYATVTDQNSSGKLPISDKQWPRLKDPTPYDIFGISSVDYRSTRLDKKSLKKKYHRYVKLYHPDHSDNILIFSSDTVTDSSSKSPLLLTSSEKLHRFKTISQAYDILCDPKKKIVYDTTRQGWNTPYSPSSNANTENYQYAGSYGYHSNAQYEYWNAGTWEDANSVKNNRIKENFNPWTAVGIVCGLAICIEGIALLEKIQESLSKADFAHEESELHLIQSYTNYGLDTDKFSRLRRFLWFRTWGLYKSKEDLDREAKINEEMIRKLQTTK
ncbi:JID1-like protein [Saccharomyces kudriavzevii IFO 1802]|uniref:J domain-containing protein 1 n=1 Tax=Saccharomyces kudriavzevii (strain ATCC MYA-4449 / AS 2.2408 / CBS 8840 / NBRC 1802 / NCYC 2889) TaxID=226230 RepID=J6EC17_SACK1|nr:JID1-like protein [Saccharomyces kudriavzevii IFO 1802]